MEKLAMWILLNCRLFRLHPRHCNCQVPSTFATLQAVKNQPAPFTFLFGKIRVLSEQTPGATPNRTHRKSKTRIKANICLKRYLGIIFDQCTWSPMWKSAQKLISQLIRNNEAFFHHLGGEKKPSPFRWWDKQPSTVNLPKKGGHWWETVRGLKKFFTNHHMEDVFVASVVSKLRHLWRNLGKYSPGIWHGA